MSHQPEPPDASLISRREAHPARRPARRRGALAGVADVRRPGADDGGEDVSDRGAGRDRGRRRRAHPAAHRHAGRDRRRRARVHRSPLWRVHDRPPSGSCSPTAWARSRRRRRPRTAPRSRRWRRRAAGRRAARDRGRAEERRAQLLRAPDPLGHHPRVFHLGAGRQERAALRPGPGRYDGCVPIDQVGRRNWTI